MRKEQQEIVQWVNDMFMEMQRHSESGYAFEVIPKHELEIRRKAFNARFAPKPMPFAEAVEAMKQGKKVRRAAWVGFENLNVRFEGNRVKWYDNKGLRNDCVFEVSDFFIADWVIYEEGV